MNKKMKDYTFEEIFNMAKIYLCDTDFTKIPKNAIIRSFGAFTAVVSITDCREDISGIIQREDIETFGVNPDRFYLGVFGRQMRWEDILFNTVMGFVTTSNPLSTNILETSNGRFYEKETMFYLTSKSMNAAMVMYPGILHDIYVFLGEEFYILPSSKMEVVIVRKSFIDGDSSGAYGLVKMVREVNEDMEMNGTNMMLSDKVHFYSIEDRNIHVC